MAKTLRRVSGFAALAGLAAISAASARADTLGPERFDAQNIRIDDFIGTVIIETAGRGRIEVTAEGEADKLADLSFTVENGALVISGEDPQDFQRRNRNWFGGRDHDDIEDEYPVIRVTAPRGLALSISDMIGRVEAGDIGGAFSMENRFVGEIEIGDVASAEVDISGATDLNISDIAGALDVQVSGAAEIYARSAESADIDVSGAGEIDLGEVRGGVTVRSSGAGDISIDSVSGPVEARLSGAGNMEIGDGRAEPLRVRVSGVGHFCFDGVAVDPDVEESGLGSIELRAYEGNLRSRGDVDIGEGC
ncbi:MAG: hypothetical protein Tsb0010_17550 [Parvularculaceae bacterium]